MYIIINKQKIKLVDCKSFFKKFKGLMLKRDINYCLRLRCNGIHTFFMRENIDVILTDKNNKIIEVIKNLKPNKILLPKKNVYYTYELPQNSIKDKIEKIEIQN